MKHEHEWLRWILEAAFVILIVLAIVIYPQTRHRPPLVPTDRVYNSAVYSPLHTAPITEFPLHSRAAEAADEPEQAECCAIFVEGSLI